MKVNEREPEISLPQAGDPGKVSLVVPVKDEADSIHRLIDSIKRQSRKPDEVIFVDGGSHDATIEILKRVCDEESSFRLITAGEATPGQGRNIGVTNARFSWIAFTDAGNILEPDWLAQLFAAAETDPEADIVCGNYDPVTETFFKVCASIAYVPGKTDRDGELIRGPAIASSLVRREAWRLVGGFPDLRAAEDLIFFEELERKGFRFKWAPKANVHWEMQPGLLSTFRRFYNYSCINVWVKRQHLWHYGVARVYVFALPFVVLAWWQSAWWLLVPLAALLARVATRIWRKRESPGLWWLINPIGFAYVLVITLTLDLATFSGWIRALIRRREAARISSYMKVRRGSASQ